MKLDQLQGMLDDSTSIVDPLRSAVLVEAEELAALLRAGAPPVILAVRAPDALPAGPWNRLERIPGSLDVDLTTELAGPGGGLAGSRPLPDITRLQTSARRWGLRATSDVVVYDHEGGLQAARAWWVLRWAGISHVRLLDGGFASWQMAGLPTVFEPCVPEVGDIELTGGHMPEMDADEALGIASTGVLIDSRMSANYEGGLSAPGEPPRGHIPGARSVPAADNLDAHGRFLASDRLRRLYAAVGADSSRAVGVYCGAGVSAAHDVLALASLGIRAPMYVGSWSAWSADPDRPVERGPAPG
jgi:thiosulfate/3-mercaptopyruvate sulfurtransferase